MLIVAKLCVLLLFGICASAANADQPSLTFKAGNVEQHFTTAQLLARPDVGTVYVPPGVDYHVAITVRAVPLLDLLAAFPLAGFDRFEARASDGFVAQIPISLVEAGKTQGSIPWIAVEEPGHPWPKLPGKDASAGPFYLVWQYPERSHVVSEQWPYMLESLIAVQSPESRWPQLKVDAALPGDAPARRGQAAFEALCMPCHRLNGAGEGAIGPDLGQPMNATGYLTETGLRALIRDPKSVRTWPQQQMPGFSQTLLPDAELDALIAYLKQIASQRS